MCANFFTKNRHDFSVTDPSSGDVIGFILSRQNGLPSWMEFDNRFLADQFFTDTPSVVNMNPEEEIPMVLSDFRAGYGQEFYEASDPKRYYFSIGADMRFKGQAILGWGSTGITIPTVPTITNADMELDSDWTGGDRSSAQAHGGTYSRRVNTVQGSSYQDLSVTIGDYQGSTIAITFWMYRETGTVASLGIDDGVGETTATTAGLDGWEQITVRRKIDGSATRLRIELTWASGNNCYFDDGTTPLWTTGKPQAHATFNSEEYVSFGVYRTNFETSF